MSVKRQATSDLNHENWDQEDPSDHEDMGQFKTAPKDVLEKRVIRTAKRRATNKDDEQKKPVFSGFGGFNKLPPSSFDFLANLTNGNKTNGSPGSKTESTPTGGLFSSKTPMLGVFNTSTSSPFAKTMFETNASQTSIQESSDSATQSTSKTNSSCSDSSLKSQTTSCSTKSTQANTLFSINPVVTSQAKSPFGAAAASDNNKSSNSVTLASSNNSSYKINQSTSTIIAKSDGPKVGVKSDSESEEKINEKKITYYTKLKGLNESVSDWIKKHVEETPLCILTPIFNDYEKYLKEIQDEYNSTEKISGVDFKTQDSDSKLELRPNPLNETVKTKKTEESGSFSGTKNTPIPLLSVPENQKNSDAIPGKSSFSFGINKSPSPSVATTKIGSFPSFSSNTSSAGGFSFGIKSPTTTNNNTSLPSSTTTSTAPTTGFTFGIKPLQTTSTTSSLFTLPTSTVASSSPTKPFSFSSDSKPFSFNSNIQKSAEKKEDNENEDDEEPPKVEFTPVVEENSVFDKRCKIFVKKDGNYIDKGIGTLYIKKVEDNDKYQLLVRANTSLGNILLNLLLTSSIPMQRLGKNNVMMVCIPTPESKPPPTPVLIRVKSSEEADALLQTLKKYNS